MNNNYELLILSALNISEHSISTLMNTHDIDKSYTQEFSNIIASLAKAKYIEYNSQKLTLSSTGTLRQKTLFNEWKQTNDILFKILKGAHYE